jgi:glutathione S-transferase
MSITFYAAPNSSASPVACALLELNVPHEKIVLNLENGDQKKPEYLALNPNGKVPTLVVDGTPMFEALAMMLWLGERYGVSQGLWPAASDPARVQALAWSVWAYQTYGVAVVRLQFATSERFSPEMHNPAQATHARAELQHLLSLLEARLQSQSHVLGSQFTLADLIVSAVVGYSLWFGTPLDSHPRVKAWLTSCQSRPAFQTVSKG